MAKMQEVICACGCGRSKEVRVADIKRGWGKYFSKSCKARKQTKDTGRGKPDPFDGFNFGGGGVEVDQDDFYE